MYDESNFMLQQYKHGISYKEAIARWKAEKQSGLWKQYKRILVPNGIVILFSAGKFTSYLMTNAVVPWRYNLVWEKTQAVGFLNSHKMPMRAHEDICVFYKKLPIYNPQMSAGHVRKVSSAFHKRNCKNGGDYGSFAAMDYDSTERYPRSVVTFASDKQKEAYHPTQKPVDLCEYLIRMYTNENDTVLDNCMGSGTTGVAAVNCNRQFIGIESDEDMFCLAKNRIASALAKTDN